MQNAECRISTRDFIGLQDDTCIRLICKQTGTHLRVPPSVNSQAQTLLPCLWRLLRDYIRFSTIVRITNTPANHFVARARRASNVFDLFLDKNVSELPLSAPERPDVFPDWSMTIAIIATHITRWMIRNAVFTKSIDFNPFRKSKSATAVMRR